MFVMVTGLTIPGKSPGVEDTAVELLWEWGGFCLGTTKDGA